MRSRVLGFPIVILLARLTTAQTTTCTREQARKAEQEASQLKSWRVVYLSFERYAICDDGAIAEGYSDSIAHLLADHWQKFRYLRKLAARHPAFKQFILRHVDELMSPEQAKTIKENARSHCPASGKALCRDILQRLESK